MIRNILASCLVMISCAVFSQTTTYKNPLGNQGVHWSSTPIMTRLDPVSGGGYILSSGGRTGVPYCALARLDSAFNILWISSFSSSDDGFIQNSQELDDHGFINLFSPSQTLFYYTKTNPAGAILFAKSYTVGSSGYLATGGVCRSAEPDTGFASMYSSCAVNNTLAKFDKYGNPEWAYDYYTYGFWGGGVYDLIRGQGHGYVNTGMCIDQFTQQRAGTLLHCGNSGQVVANTKILLDTSSSAIHTGLGNPVCSKTDNGYYCTGYTFHGSPFTNDPYLYLLKTDSSLNPTACWRIDPPMGNQLITVKDIASSADGSVIITGILTDTLNPVFNFFILRFLPSSGTISWSKSVKPLINPQWPGPSFPQEGIAVSSSTGNIVFPLHNGDDGDAIAEIDPAGTSLCIAQDTAFTVSPYYGYNYSSFTIYVTPLQFVQYNESVSLVAKEYQDTVLCGPLSIAENSPEPVNAELISAVNTEDGWLFRSLTGETVLLTIYNPAGQIVYSGTIQPYETIYKTNSTAGIYLLRAETKLNLQTNKIMGFAH